ncbi:MAG TPA: hypothetical protein VFW14_00380 [Gaiellales bacterium]|nr:hypothetical protein [Gaiellales bacterium]
MTRSSAGSVLVVVLVLVGIPLGAFIVARDSKPHHHASPIALEMRRLTADLKRQGATHITCGWTGYVNGGSTTVTCSGTARGGLSGSSMYALGDVLSNAPA